MSTRSANIEIYHILTFFPFFNASYTLLMSSCKLTQYVAGLPITRWQCRDSGMFIGLQKACQKMSLINDCCLQWFFFFLSTTVALMVALVMMWNIPDTSSASPADVSHHVAAPRWRQQAPTGAPLHQRESRCCLSRYFKGKIVNVGQETLLSFSTGLISVVFLLVCRLLVRPATPMEPRCRQTTIKQQEIRVEALRRFGDIFTFTFFRVFPDPSRSQEVQPLLWLHDIIISEKLPGLCDGKLRFLVF